MERRHAMIYNFASDPSQRGTILSYPAALSAADQILFPTFEGTIGDDTLVDRHGDPELMADFAEEYLRQFWMLIPTGRLPQTLKEIMPALLLLFTATELALKAFWIRSGRQLTSHSLTDLYQELDAKHRRDIEARFASSELPSALSALGVDAPTVEPATFIWIRGTMPNLPRCSGRQAGCAEPIWSRVILLIQSS